MLNMDSINVSGTSQIEDKTVVYFNASNNGSQDKGYSSTKSISDMDAYLANQVQCDKDYAEFDAAAMEIMSQIGNR
ncbi:hypothetical protein [Bacteroides acidifaciens]|uniref:hypothetical protein n=1 Tax=Bacteroides acidifaciens TaxID=85831 RepID=UPI00243164CF|nr:hypothetical protein [Bacteroides acidifaciens]